jgi:hypothetical protein
MCPLLKQHHAWGYDLQCGSHILSLELETEPHQEHKPDRKRKVDFPMESGAVRALFLGFYTNTNPEVHKIFLPL